MGRGSQAGGPSDRGRCAQGAGRGGVGVSAAHGSGRSGRARPPPNWRRDVGRSAPNPAPHGPGGRLARPHRTTGRITPDQRPGFQFPTGASAHSGNASGREGTIRRSCRRSAAPQAIPKTGGCWTLHMLPTSHINSCRNIHIFTLVSKNLNVTHVTVKGECRTNSGSDNLSEHTALSDPEVNGHRTDRPRTANRNFDRTIK